MAPDETARSFRTLHDIARAGWSARITCCNGHSRDLAPGDLLALRDADLDTARFRCRCGGKGVGGIGLLAPGYVDPPPRLPSATYVEPPKKPKLKRLWMLAVVMDEALKKRGY